MFQNLLYHLLKRYCQIALNFYFKQWQVNSVEKIPSGPVIFVSNHQNAFLDAVLIACSSPRNPWFLARANVFKKKWASTILGWLRMSPVYRFRDGYNTLKNNDAVFDHCVKVLSANHSLLIFGEGNHNPNYNLLPLQKGFVRIAFDAETKNDWNLGLSIVPVGLYFEERFSFRTRVLVNYGTPIKVKDHFDNTKTIQENYQNIITSTEAELKKLILNIDEKNHDRTLAYLEHERKIYDDLVEQIQKDQEIVNKENLSFSDTSIKSKSAQSNWNWYGKINHFIPRLILKKIIVGKVKDPQFIASIKFAVGMFIVPFFYALQTMLVFYITSSSIFAVAYLITLPLSILLKR